MTTVIIPTRRELRLAAYLRSLERVDTAVAPSAELAALAGVTAERFRRDMSWVGRRLEERLGRQGVGYDVPSLRQALRRLLRVDTPRTVAVVGADGEDEVHAAVQTSSYFRLVDAGEDPDFVLLVGGGPWPQVEVSPEAVVLHWAREGAAANGPHVAQVDPVRLLLAVSASLAREGGLYPS